MRAREFIKPKQRKTNGTANNNLSPASLGRETQKPMTANEIAAQKKQKAGGKDK